MSYNKAKTFDRADEELDKAVKEKKEKVERSEEEKKLDKFWGEQFKDLVERVYIVMKDGKTFTINSQDEKRVNLDIGVLDEHLRGVKGKEYSVKDIDTIIHNHFRSPSFTLDDKNQYRRLKKFGFTGKFKMYNHMREQVYEYNPDEKKKENKKELKVNEW